jgi:ABC-type nitrate/sulfonate/bicarbonate transport system substrate-binding protein
MKKLRLALDWTPNVNHIGFFIAQERGFYKDLHIDLEIIHPGQDHYAITPAKKVELNQADLALCPMESILSYQTKSDPFPLQAIATIYQEDVSAIAVVSNSQIERPADLSGKSYASYKARYEDQIVKQMIAKDGGKPDLKIDYPAKLGIWVTLISRIYDSTWIFTNWEGADQRIANGELRCFRMKDYGIPYSYSPVIATSKNLIQEESTILQSFLKATKKGYTAAVENPDHAVDVLRPLVAETDQHVDLKKSVELSKDAYGIGQNWGRMDQDNVQQFLDWLQKHEIEKTNFEMEDIITNELLP